MVKSKLFFDWAGFLFLVTMLMLTLTTIWDTVEMSAPYIVMMALFMGLMLFIGLVKKFVFEVDSE